MEYFNFSNRNIFLFWILWEKTRENTFVALIFSGFLPLGILCVPYPLPVASNFWEQRHTPANDNKTTWTMGHQRIFLLRKARKIWELTWCEGRNKWKINICWQEQRLAKVMRVRSDTFGDPILQRAYKISHPPWL